MSENTNNTQSKINITCVTNDNNGPSYFAEKAVALNGNNQRMLSEQISAVNFRLRSSDQTYASDWHVAGDPTLLIVLSGCVQIELRNGDTKKFTAGQMFIAEDFLNKDYSFNDKNGHRARVLGNNEINVLHLKLDKRS